jgi:capping protein alpha
MLNQVQLALSSSPTITLPPVLVASLPETSSAKKIMALIEAEETAFQSRLKEKIDEMSDKTFKSLRRLLPLTRQKVDWEKVSLIQLVPPRKTQALAKIMAYKLGAELNASKTAFGTAGVVDDRQEKQDE